MGKPSKKSLESQSEESKADKFFNLGLEYMESGKPDEAVDTFMKALEIYRRLKGENYEKVGYLRNNLANCMLQKEELDKADFHLKMAMDNFTWSGKHRWVADVIHKMGVVFREREKFREAHEHFQKATEMYKALFGENSSYIAVVALNWGTAYWDEEKINEAMAQYKKAEEILKLHPKDNFGLATLVGVYTNMGNMLEEQRRIVEAQKYFKKCRQIKQKLSRTWLGSK